MERDAGGAQGAARPDSGVRGCAAQVARLHRVVTAEEYDDAARRKPMTCPLLAMGDYRSGRQVGGGVGRREREREQCFPTRNADNAPTPALQLFDTSSLQPQHTVMQK